MRSRSTTPETIRITISDHGPGIPAQERERVFDRFVRLDASREHTSGSTGLDAATASFIGNHSTVDAVGHQAVTAVGTLNTAGKTVNPYAGGDRYVTSRTVATALVQGTGKAPAVVGIADGLNFPDALTGGADAANAGAPVLLTDPSTAGPDLLNTLQGWRTSLTAIETFGGTGAVSQHVEDQIAGAVNGKEIDPAPAGGHGHLNRCRALADRPPTPDRRLRA